MHDWRADVRARLQSARLHPQDEAEIAEEIAQHLEQQFDEMAPTLGAEAARERLLEQLSHPGFDEAAAGRRHRARPTRARAWSSTSMLRDVRYGVRSLRRSPGMVVAGTAALALGIGLTAVMYSVIYGVLIKGLPYDDPSRIARITYVDPARQIDPPIPLGEFVHYRARQQSFEVFGAYFLGTASVTGGDRPDHVNAARMTAGAFDVTRVRPLLGRTFTPSDNEPGAPPTAVLGYTVWRDRYGADSSAVGKIVRVNGRPYTIVGVMPERFEFPQETKVWLPLQVNAAALGPNDGPAVSIVARLRRDVTYERANAEIDRLFSQLAAERAPPTTELRPLAQPFVRAVVPTRTYAMLYAMLGAVLLVLLVACANVANLLLDRAASRSREIGIRTALGASRSAVVRQSLVESSILAALAAVVGTGLAQAGVIAFNSAIVERPFWMDIRLHPPVLAFVLALAVLASLASGLLPALQSARLDVSAILKDESHAASGLRVGRLSRTIVTVQIVLSSALLLAAGFMTKSIAKLHSVDPGFATAGVYTARVNVASTDSTRRRRFFEALEQELAAVPGVAGAYLGSGLPGNDWNGEQVEIEGRTYDREQDYPAVRSLAVSPGFFATFDVRVVRGRAIAATDRTGSLPVAVVSEAFARRNFPGADPIGQRIRLGGAGSDREWLTIVGVMPTLFAASMRDPWPAEVVTAFWQERRGSSASIAVRGRAEVATAASIRKVVAGIDPEVPVYAAESMDAVLARPMWPVRVFGGTFVIFGVASLVLAAIGLYAVMAFSVGRRVREMGIRTALGATGGDIIRMVCAQGAKQMLLGTSLGFVAGAAMVSVARAALFEVAPGDPAVFALVAGVLGAAAFVACIIPAIRATRVDPVIALRTE